ncbi:MAG TPA: DNA (cytosine-5-)-methyltransferase [Candidatus Bathyarchaeia archaeon]
MRFVDLFAGLGGFNLALGILGHQCVFASEIDKELRELYELNFGLAPAGDIRRVHESVIPEHDVLCAGFPCAPFSKAGTQPGTKDRELGLLYKEILRIVRYHKPNFVILENVPNLQLHDKGKTWERIERLLRREGYYVSLKKLSPHHFGIPQIRERIYIVGGRLSLSGFAWPEPSSPTPAFSVSEVLDRNPVDARPVPENVQNCLSVWQDFLNRIPKTEKVPHPVWSMEFGATYPYNDRTPFGIPLRELTKHRGSFGCRLHGSRRNAVFLQLPSHARRPQKRFPDWKVEFIQKNREFYRRHKIWIDRWKPKIMAFPSSFQKLEWNCQGDVRTIRKNVVQIRASGVRVKRPTTAPSLVAMTATQIPIITWEDRYMTPNECKRLQSMDDLKHLPTSSAKAYEALGDAINVEVARRVAEALLGPSGKPVTTEFGMRLRQGPLDRARSQAR